MGNIVQGKAEVRTYGVQELHRQQEVSMTKRKYVTREELREEMELEERERRSQEWNILISGVFFSLFVTIALIFGNNFLKDYNQLNFESYCAENETMIEFTGHDCVWTDAKSCTKNLNDNTIICIGDCKAREVTTNRCLDWKWRDKA